MNVAKYWMPLLLLAFHGATSVGTGAEQSPDGGAGGLIAPLFVPLPDVIIGDLEPPQNSTAPGEFVYPDALDLRIFFITDDNSTSETVKWSFLDVGGDIQINGVDSLDSSLSGIGADDPTDPRIESQIVANDLDSAEGDSNAFTITFRNKTLSPDLGPKAQNPKGGPAKLSLPPSSNILTLFASDGTTFSSSNFTVYTVGNTSDALSGGIVECFPIGADFDDGQSHGWVGENLFGFEGTTSISTTPGLSGLCMTTGGAGDFAVSWRSPYGLVALADNTVYRVRAVLTTDQTALDSIPLWRMTYINFDPSTGFQNFGGNRWFVDHQGGSAGIGRNRHTFDMWLTPNCVSSPAWRSPDGGIFDPANADFANFSIAFEVLDFNDAIVADQDSGTICVQSVHFESFTTDEILQGGATVYDTPISAQTHTFSPFPSLTHTGTGTAAEVQSGQARVQLFEPTSMNNLAFAGADGQQFEPGIDPLPGYVEPADFPVAWEADVLYMFEADLRQESSETDPLGIIILGQDSPTFEQIAEDYSWRAPAGSTLDRAASPKLTTTTYRNFWYSHDVTTAPGLALTRGFLQLFNRGDLNLNAGGDVTLVTGMRIRKLTSPPTSPCVQ